MSHAHTRLLTALAIYTSWIGQIKLKDNMPADADATFDKDIQDCFNFAVVVNTRKGSSAHEQFIHDFEKAAHKALARVVDKTPADARIAYVVSEAANILLVDIRATCQCLNLPECFERVDMAHRALYEDDITEQEAILGYEIYAAICDKLKDKAIAKALRKAK